MVRTVSNAFAAEPHPAGLDADRRPRGRQDDDGPHPRPRASTTTAGRPRRGPSIDMPELGIALPGHHGIAPRRRARDGRGLPYRRREHPPDHRRASATRPAQARYKVYIIDEVHMLSTAAFNAFLKTLEEPPPHAKFVFATTEIRKVPVTILSRCQRFDLRRVESGGARSPISTASARRRASSAEPEALAAIARAAEGSVRDALSLLDQAVAHGAGARHGGGRARHARPRRPGPGHRPVRGRDAGRRAGRLRDRCGPATRPAPIPRQMLADLASFTHLVTRMKLVAGGRRRSRR